MRLGELAQALSDLWMSIACAKNRNVLACAALKIIFKKVRWKIFKIFCIGCVSPVTHFQTEKTSPKCLTVGICPAEKNACRQRFSALSILFLC